MRDAAARASRFAFLALLVALSAWRAGVPSATTAFALGATFLIAGGLRFAVARGRDGGRRFAPAAAWTGAAFAVAIASLLATGERGRFAWTWWLLAGMPLGLRLALMEASLVPRPPLAAAAFFATLALGLLGAEPWSDLVGRVLLSALAVALVTGAALESAARLLPSRLPPPPRASWRRAIATLLVLALLALLAAVGLDLVLTPIERPWQRPPPPPREDPLANELGAEAGGGGGGRSVALVRLQGGAAVSAPPVARMRLRERVLDELVDADGLVYLAPRAGAPRFLRDDDDGDRDGHIATAARAPSAADVAPDSTWQVTLLQPSLRALLQVEVPQWIEGDRLTLLADGSLERPNQPGETITYRVGAATALAFVPPPSAAVAALAAEARDVPERFLGRETLARLVAENAAGEQPDPARALALIGLLKRTGRIDPAAPFKGWTDFAIWRTGSPMHFAQCAALLLRLARLPARVVRGYECERWRADEKSFEVRSSDEHWWVEVAWESAGWVAYDPVPELPGEADEAQLEQQRLAEEAQKRDQFDRQSLQNTLATQRPLIAGILLLLLVAAVFAFPTVRSRVEQLLLRRGPAGSSGAARRAWRFWQELLDRCARHGLHSHPSFTAAEFASLVAQALPTLRPSLIELLRAYHAGRFGNRTLAPQEEERVRAILSDELPAALTEWQRARAAATPPAAVPPRNRR